MYLDRTLRLHSSIGPGLVTSSRVVRLLRPNGYPFGRSAVPEVSDDEVRSSTANCKCNGLLGQSFMLLLKCPRQGQCLKTSQTKVEVHMYRQNKVSFSHWQPSVYLTPYLLPKCYSNHTDVAVYMLVYLGALSLPSGARFRRLCTQV